MRDINTQNTKENELFAKIIVRQGEGSVEMKRQIEELKNLLIEERANRIDDLKTINYIATSNSYSNEKIILRKVAETTADTLKEITNGIIQKEKELSTIPTKV